MPHFHQNILLSSVSDLWLPSCFVFWHICMSCAFEMLHHRCLLCCIRYTEPNGRVWDVFAEQSGLAVEALQGGRGVTTTFLGATRDAGDGSFLTGRVEEAF